MIGGALDERWFMKNKELVCRLPEDNGNTKGCATFAGPGVSGEPSHPG